MKKLELQIPENPYNVEEALNRLRINVKFCGQHTKKIMVTSSVPNEGKSVVALQLWKAMADAGFPTVFVDMDLRKSTLKNRHDYQAKDEIVGMNYYISGLAEYEDIIYETNIENGHIIPCVHLLDNPSTLFEEERLNELFARLSEEYRYIIIDTPPLGVVADGAQIAHLCDGAILVVRGGETSKHLIRQSLQQLEHVNCKLLGTVLNRVQTKSHSYYKYYGKYGKYNSYYSDYGYGFGNSEEDANN